MIDRSKLTRTVRNMNGKTRVLYSYSADYPELRKQHDAYAAFLNRHFMASTFSHAYTKRRSIYTNAKIHLRNDLFIKVDVKSFFPTLNHKYLIDSMHFELNKKSKNTISLSECKELVSNSSLQKTGLPLGLVPSPVLSNIYMKRFDGLLYGKLKKLNLPDVMYSRYADDIFISFKAQGLNTTPHDAFEAVLKICTAELKRCHLKVNSKKTKFINLAHSNHVKVAGINIVKSTDGTRKITISRKIVKNLYFRAMAVARDKSTEASANKNRDTEINYIKGMQSFILSVEKRGYSHILSSRMQEPIKTLGYDSLEDLIANL